ncbi:MAG: serine/threonine protein kinase, bacterial [Mycobacterium sp.]|jgi:serine/threonine-protein kinase|nr:serine/threonine protein kinase, bacterial [Mycobacterium sp.]
MGETLTGSGDSTQVPGPEVVLGRYRLLSMIGEGGMGQVWRAHDSQTDRVVALKLLPHRLANDDAIKERFRRECRALAQVAEPHVIPIHDFGDIDGRLFLNMRLINGIDLRWVISNHGPLSPERAVAVITQVADALHAVHDAGVVHRDVKPSNILLDDEDFVYLIDFGIAHDLDDPSLTSTGQTIGTFAYIAPEAIEAGDTTDSRVDVYALACVLYESLTGREPFPGTKERNDLIAHHRFSPPPRPSSGTDVPEAFDDVITKGMAKDPDDRYRSVLEFAAAARAALGESAGLFSAGGNPGTGWRLSLSRTAVGLVAAAIVVALIAAVVITVVIDHTGR